MDIAEFFKQEDRVRCEFRGKITIHHLREPTDEEHIQYRRMASQVRLVDNQPQMTASSLKAPLWLYDTITTKVEIENGNGAAAEDVPNFKDLVTKDLKIAVISGWLGRLGRVEIKFVRNEEVPDRDHQI